MIVFTKRLIKLLAFITTAILCLLYFHHQSIWSAIPVMALGILWLKVGVSRLAASQIGFVVVSLLVVIDVVQYGVNLWVIACIHSALAMWDLLTYLNRLHSIEMTNDINIITRRHLNRLGYVILIGIVLSLVTFYFQIDLSLVGILISGLVLMIALSRTVTRLRQVVN